MPEGTTDTQVSGFDAIARQKIAALRTEIGRFIVGQEALVERLLVALLADGHVLLEGVPGLAKTRTLTVLTAAIDSKMHRVQFTPDLLPSDLLGTEVFQPQRGDFVIRKGPVFANLLLADEINRAPAKVQSALLQAMQEREVTIGEATFKLPTPFMVLATQNPIEQEGTYPLPEAQVDRFLMKIKVNYPSFDEEVQVLELISNPLKAPPPLNGESGAPEVSAPLEHAVRKILTLPELLEARACAARLYADPRIDRYIVSLVRASREQDLFGLKGMIDWGASPRASIALKLCGRALAFLRGRQFVTPDEIKEIAPDVLRHRILPSFEAEARGINSDEIVKTILKSVTV
jgi:MoxR-like ATPase